MHDLKVAGYQEFLTFRIGYVSDRFDCQRLSIQILLAAIGFGRDVPTFVADPSSDQAVQGPRSMSVDSLLLTRFLLLRDLR